jgi:GntR family transcriptional repressor for pyruvate dehydrogenase complex
LASIEKRKLSDSVIEEIKRMMESGELKEGDKLPNQNEFAAQLGVSRASLREALHTLNLVGAIEQRPGMGTVIKSLNPTLWVDQLSPPLVSDAKATLELLEARRFIEVGVVELAVQHATKEDVQNLNALVQKMKVALKEDRMADYSRLDMSFHHQIAEAAHNRYMLHMFVNIRGMMEQFIREAFTVIPGLLQRSLTFHVSIYEGIRERDRKKAATSMKNHIQDIASALKQYYEADRDDPASSHVKGSTNG